MVINAVITVGRLILSAETIQILKLSITFILKMHVDGDDNIFVNFDQVFSHRLAPPQEVLEFPVLGLLDAVSATEPCEYDLAYHCSWLERIFHD